MKKARKDEKDENDFFERNQDWVSAVAGGMLGFLTVVIVSLLCVCTGGCVTRTAGESVDLIARDSQLRGRLESTIESLDGTISDSLERIESVLEDSRKIESGAKRLDFLFSRYEQEVYRLINEMRGASDRIKDSVENYLDTDRNSIRSSGDGYSVLDSRKEEYNGHTMTEEHK